MWTDKYRACTEILLFVGEKNLYIFSVMFRSFSLKKKNVPQSSCLFSDPSLLILDLISTLTVLEVQYVTLQT